MGEILYIDSKDTLVPLHHATTTAVQMAAPVPEIMDIPLYYLFFCGLSVSVHLDDHKILWHGRLNLEQWN
jgi:hypothetical protein